MDKKLIRDLQIDDKILKYDCIKENEFRGENFAQLEEGNTDQQENLENLIDDIAKEKIRKKRDKLYTLLLFLFNILISFIPATILVQGAFFVGGMAYGSSDIITPFNTIAFVPAILILASVLTNIIPILAIMLIKHLFKKEIFNFRFYIFLMIIGVIVSYPLFCLHEYMR